MPDGDRRAAHPGPPRLDLAASEFFDKGRYHYRDRTLDVDGQLRFLVDLVERFDLRYIEDPFEEEDFASFAAFTDAVGSRALVVGDDLFTTSEERVARGIRERSANSVLIKVNQVGTLTDTLDRGAGPEEWLADRDLPPIGRSSRGLARAARRRVRTRPASSAGFSAERGWQS